MYCLLGASVCAITGAVMDLRSHRIPNWLTYSGIGIALLLRFVLGGWGDLKSGVAGMGLGTGIFFLFFLVRGIGAGDVKLMAAVSAWVGLDRTMSVVLATAVAGAILAMIYMVFYKRIFSTLRNVGSLLWFHITSGMRTHPKLNLREQGTIRLPYGLAIAIGTLYVLISSTHPSGVIYGH